jgi:hypothetical protein
MHQQMHNSFRYPLENEWILGFDCHRGQTLDYGPYQPFGVFGENPKNYRNLSYVISECERLAAQLFAAANV